MITVVKEFRKIMAVKKSKMNEDVVYFLVVKNHICYNFVLFEVPRGSIWLEDSEKFQ